ncbi:hypothetical protein AB1Y20_013875 [Prymnesium parvum]|uniref:Uncharacterized protein n=1 Tax=Prymnesium parvum TaxID=97485 RepID=A0AB34IGR3_PRYPA
MANDPMAVAARMAMENPEATQRVVNTTTATAAAIQGADPEKKSLSAGARVMGGAAVVGGLAAGIVTGSALLGVAAAGATAYAATRNDKIGDAAKATGKAANAVGSKAAEINREHNLTGRGVEGIKAGYQSMQAIDSKYGISRKASTGIKAGVGAITGARSEPPSMQPVPPSNSGASAPLQPPVVIGQYVAPNGYEVAQVVVDSYTGPHEGDEPPPPPPPDGHVGVYPPRVA